MKATQQFILVLLFAAVSGTGCSSTDVERFAWPTHGEAKGMVGRAMDQGTVHFNILHEDHKKMLEPGATGADLDAIREQYAQELVVHREAVANMQSSLAALIREEVNPMAKRLLGVELFSETQKDKLKATETNASTALSMVKSQELVSTALTKAQEELENKQKNLEAVLSGIRDETLKAFAALSEQTKSAIINAAASDPTFQAVLEKHATSPDEVRSLVNERVTAAMQMAGISEDKIAEMRAASEKTGKDMGELLYLLVGGAATVSAGASTVLSRVISPSGKKIDAMKDAHTSEIAKLKDEHKKEIDEIWDELQGVKISTATATSAPPVRI